LLFVLTVPGPSRRFQVPHRWELGPKLLVMERDEITTLARRTHHAHAPAAGNHRFTSEIELTHDIYNIVDSG
jgi:hypothetical protein